MAPQPSTGERAKKVEPRLADRRSHQALRHPSTGMHAVELHFAGIIHAAMDAIVTVNDEQRVVQFNAAAEKMFGCSAREAMGKSIDRFIPERFRAEHRRHVKRFGDAHVTNRRMEALGTISGLRSDGKEFPIEASVSQIKEGDRRLFTVILRDVTERKELERQLRQTERLAELGTLATGMAHEIGTPMNVILGRTEYLMHKTSDDATKQGLATIVAQVERITRIMNQLLSFARRKPLERRPLAMSLVVHDILDVVQERLEQREIRLQVHLASSCPSVVADRDQMGQVVLNLVMNAIQAMPNGGALTITLTSDARRVHLALADNGCGIPKDNVPKLFMPFFTTKGCGEGTGLGLTVVHGIVQEHEGSIFVESQPGRGTTFTISLPASD